MRVAFVPRYGPPEVVEFREMPMPVPRASEIRIKVLTTCVTAADWRVRSGDLPRGFGLLRGVALGFGGPRKGVLGTDAAGIVDAIGPAVTRFAVGDEVVAFPGSAMGAHAQYLLMPAAGRVLTKPANLSFDEVVALPFGGMTARDYLRRSRLQSGERVLIHGAAGNVGTAAIQLAKHAGAHVTAVCSAANAALVESLGADVVVDYSERDFAAGPDQYDVILDAVGNAPYSRVKSVLARGGRLLAIVADLSALLQAGLVPRRHGHRVIAGPATERREDLEALVALAGQGILKPVIQARFPFDQIVAAYRVVDSRRKRGSVVVTLEH